MQWNEIQSRPLGAVTTDNHNIKLLNAEIRLSCLLVKRLTCLWVIYQLHLETGRGSGEVSALTNITKVVWI